MHTGNVTFVVISYLESNTPLKKYIVLTCLMVMLYISVVFFFLEDPRCYFKNGEAYEHYVNHSLVVQSSLCWSAEETKAVVIQVWCLKSHSKIGEKQIQIFPFQKWGTQFA